MVRPRLAGQALGELADPLGRRLERLYDLAHVRELVVDLVELAVRPLECIAQAVDALREVLQLDAQGGDLVSGARESARGLRDLVHVVEHPDQQAPGKEYPAEHVRGTYPPGGGIVARLALSRSASSTRGRAQQQQPRSAGSPQPWAGRWAGRRIEQSRARRQSRPE